MMHSFCIHSLGGSKPTLVQSFHVVAVLIVWFIMCHVQCAGQQWSEQCRSGLLRLLPCVSRQWQRSSVWTDDIKLT